MDCLLLTHDLSRGLIKKLFFCSLFFIKNNRARFISVLIFRIELGNIMGLRLTSFDYAPINKKALREKAKGLKLNRKIRPIIDPSEPVCNFF